MNSFATTVNPFHDKVGLSDAEVADYKSLGVDERTITRAFTALRFLNLQGCVFADVVSQKKILSTLIQQLNAHVKSDFAEIEAEKEV